MRPIEEIERELRDACDMEKLLMKSVRRAQERLREHNRSDIIPLLEELNQAKKEAEHDEER